MSRNKESKHDKTVRRSAGGYKGKGYSVSADVQGYRKPKLIGGRRPDLIARKGSREVVVEVETPSSHKRDSSQQEAQTEDSEQRRRGKKC